ncbi:hypothetical protein MIND_01152200 [Mycena indigotica]|uniref:Uncharacterized protein n=1 Tax=Mycena indigotica TaxID=2126181 RepID=A0A8H6RVA9_9AGAR|nr:uncharacterized protein MIND_01430700 [Mycena indigotica]XP_037215883.1 uncharacterized protein MIND_01152200 [Mycena indigotica]KAF7288485.1 hypothetical protein MIND_01430700 [Mycena indigotica]KAF7293720.1 hypothetical protein MIND_01152200 [Mycena indigotica]
MEALLASGPGTQNSMQRRKPRSSSLQPPPVLSPLAMDGCLPPHTQPQTSHQLVELPSRSESMVKGCWYPCDGTWEALWCSGHKSLSGFSDCFGTSRPSDARDFGSWQNVRIWEHCRKDRRGGAEETVYIEVASGFTTIYNHIDYRLVLRYSIFHRYSASNLATRNSASLFCLHCKPF